jgi:hypothetical protein
LRGHARFLQPRIRGHEANLIDADSLCAGERGLQLQRQFGGLGFPGGKCAHEASQLILRHGRKELHAGEPSGGQQLRELFFSGCAFQRYAIEQELRTRRA